MPQVLPKEWTSFTVTITMLVPMPEWDAEAALKLTKSLVEVSGCSACRLRVLFPIQRKPATPPSFDGEALATRAHALGSCCVSTAACEIM